MSQKSFLVINIILSCVIFLPNFSSFGQTNNKINAKIDSVKLIESKLINELNDIKQKMKDFENQLLNIEMQKYKETGYISKVKMEASLREEPKTTSKLIKIIPKGSEVTLLSYSNDFWKVVYEGKYGYLYFRMFDNDEIMLNMIEEAKRRQEEEKMKAEQAKKEEREKEKERIKAQQSEQLAKRRSELIKKYGKVTGEKILKGLILLGMTTEMVKDSWGEPKNINRSVGCWGVHEQWRYGSKYLYFENGKLKSWQD